MGTTIHFRLASPLIKSPVFYNDLRLDLKISETLDQCSATGVLRLTGVPRDDVRCAAE